MQASYIMWCYEYNTVQTMAASLVLFNFRSAIELPVIKIIYPPAKPAITAIVINIIMTTRKFVAYFYVLAKYENVI